MNNQEKVDQILATLTPEKLREVIVNLAQTQAADNREGVAIGQIMDALGDPSLTEKTGGWEVFMKFRQAIRDTVAQIQGMRYIEVDS